MTRERCPSEAWVYLRAKRRPSLFRCTLPAGHPGPHHAKTRALGMTDVLWERD